MYGKYSVNENMLQSVQLVIEFISAKRYVKVHGNIPAVWLVSCDIIRNDRLLAGGPRENVLVILSPRITLQKSADFVKV